MAFGDITVTLRPIKFAFLVNPSERKALDGAIRVSLFLWGGLHNPIIPIFRRVPSNWSHLPTRRLPPSDICKGYIRTFDPDAVVLCGIVDKSVVPSHVRHVVTLDELTGELGKEDAPALGVGLFEVLADFAREEFRYVRRDGMKILMPTFAGAGSTLFRAVFGEIPSEAKRETYGELLKAIQSDQPHVTLGNFLQTIREPSYFLSSLCAHKLEFRRPRGEDAVAVFLMKHDSPLDIIDFWNLRAMGWHVLPIPLKLSELDETRDYVRRFIERHTPTERDVAAINRVRLLKARSVPEAEFMAFVNSIPRAAVTSLTAQVWYPPMWDEFSRRGGRLTCSSIAAGQAQTQVSDESSQVRIKALAPDFMTPNLDTERATRTTYEFPCMAAESLAQRSCLHLKNRSRSYLALDCGVIGAWVRADRHFSADTLIGQFNSINHRHATWSRSPSLTGAGKASNFLQPAMWRIR